MANLRADKITSTETFEKTGSVQFDGNSDYLETDKAPFQMLHKLTSSWTVESWIYLQDPGNQLTVFDTGGSSSTTIGLSLYIDSQIKFRLRQALSSLNVSLSVTHNLNYHSWHHLSVTFDYDTKIIRIFVDGKIVGSTIYGIESSTDSNKDFKIGAYEYSTDTIDGHFKGHISNMRVLDSKALYTENFKPPMKELEVTPETVLLACQSKTDATLEKTGKTLTANGTAVASELTPGILTPVPKAGAGSAITGSVEFDGAGDYMTVTETEDFDFGTGDFTIEYWYWESNNSKSERRTLDMRDSTRQWMIGHTNDNGGKIFFEAVTGGVTVQVFSENNANTTGDRENWRHLAVVRNGNTITIYLDGVNRGSGSFTGTIRDDQNTLNIGRDSSATTRNYQGFLSNLRIVKGTALYTDDFIPPTRELKKVPGTVLLCCQDPDSPLTEATGKTITGYGDLYELDESVDLSTTASWVDGSTGAGSASESNGELTMQGDGASDRGILSKTVTEGIRPGVTYQMSFEVFDAATNGKTGLDSNDGTNDVLDDPTATLDMVHFSGSVDLDGRTGIFTVEGVATTHQVVMYFQEFGAAGTTEFKVRNITLRAVNTDSTNINKASNFTPQVGDDRKVTFEGVTKVNSDAYFYLPTGDTVTRESRYGRSRGLIVGGGNSDTIEFVNIASTGNAQDYGNLSATTSYVSALSSSTRGVYSRSRTPSSPNGDNTLEYSTLASTGNSIDFGDRTEAVYDVGALSSSIRGIIGGGYGPSNSNVIDYVTISSTGNALDFGDLTQARRSIAGLASPTRGCLAGGYQQPDTTTETSAIDYLTIASTGNAIDFGDLAAARWGAAPMASSTRGVFGGGIDPNALNLIDYITIASTGNANDFGDISQHATGRNTGISNSVRGVAGTYLAPAYQNSWEYITIQSMGNALDFGESAVDNSGLRGGCSDSHGGLG